MGSLIIFTKPSNQKNQNPKTQNPTILKTFKIMNNYKLILIAVVLISSISAGPTIRSCSYKSKSDDDESNYKKSPEEYKQLDTFPSERADYLVEDILFLNPLSALEEAENEEDSDYISDEDVLFADLKRHKFVMTEEEVEREIGKQKSVEFQFKDC